jgi:riboflavin synthase
LFTGIIEETGVIRSLRPSSAGAKLFVTAVQVSQDMKIGDSVAVNGVCLTATAVQASGFSCDLSAETMQRSSFRQAREGTAVNLERPLALGDRLGGHWMQGHVDGVGRLVSSIPSGEGVAMEFSFGTELEKYLVFKGSVAVDGISLTVATLAKDRFGVAVIPHTYRATNLQRLSPGDLVNLEGDIIAKYLERFFQLGMISERSPRPRLTVEALREQGY